MSTHNCAIDRKKAPNIKVSLKKSSGDLFFLKQILRFGQFRGKNEVVKVSYFQNDLFVFQFSQKNKQKMSAPIGKGKN